MYSPASYTVPLRLCAIRHIIYPAPPNPTHFSTKSPSGRHLETLIPWLKEEQKRLLVLSNDDQKQHASFKACFLRTMAQTWICTLADWADGRIGFFGIQRLDLWPEGLWGTMVYMAEYSYTRRGCWKKTKALPYHITRGKRPLWVR